MTWESLNHDESDLDDGSKRNLSTNSLFTRFGGLLAQAGWIILVAVNFIVCLLMNAFGLAGTNVFGLALALLLGMAFFSGGAACPPANVASLEIAAGATSFLIDSAIRKLSGHPTWWHWDYGCRLLFFPMWLWGIGWMVVGSIKIIIFRLNG